MANRSCPLCFSKLPRTTVLARSDGLACPSCHSDLELSRSSRVSAALVGVLVAFAGVWLVDAADGDAAWFTSVAVAVVVYGVASVAFLLFFSDLVVRPKPSPAFPQIHG
jgi:hypothetical protein